MARVNIPTHEASKLINPGSAPKVHRTDAVGRAVKGLGSALGAAGNSPYPPAVSIPTL